MARLPKAWRMKAGRLQARYTFPDFAQAFAFLTEVALVAQRKNHHPDFAVHWGTVDFTLWSHDEGKVTARDRAMAPVLAKIAARHKAKTA